MNDPNLYHTQFINMKPRRIMKYVNLAYVFLSKNSIYLFMLYSVIIRYIESKTKKFPVGVLNNRIFLTKIHRSEISGENGRNLFKRFLCTRKTNIESSRSIRTHCNYFKVNIVSFYKDTVLFNFQ